MENAWVYIIIAYILGKVAGVIMMAILYGSWDKMEERAKEKNRRRGNADGTLERR